MSYFTRIGNRLVTRLITYGIFLHLTVCAATIGCALLLLAAILEHAEAGRLAAAVARGEIALPGVVLVRPDPDQAYRAITGHTPAVAWAMIAGRALLALLVGWLSVWGFFFIKRGGLRRHPQARR